MKCTEMSLGWDISEIKRRLRCVFNRCPSQKSPFMEGRMRFYLLLSPQRELSGKGLFSVEDKSLVLYNV